MKLGYEEKMFSVNHFYEINDTEQNYCMYKMLITEH